MALEWESNVEDVETLSTFDSALFYGDSGRGKTNLAASAIHAGFKKPLIVDIEGSAKGVGRLNPGVKVIRTPTFDHLEVMKHDLLHEQHGYDFLIFDTLNAGQKMAERKFAAAPENRNNKFGKWDDLLNWTEDWLYSFHYGPIPVVFLAHAQDDKNELTGSVKTVPKVKGSARESVPTIPDIVGYLQFENIGGSLERVLYAGASDTLVTKNRFGMPDKIVKPSIAEINRLIEGAKEGAE